MFTIYGYNSFNGIKVLLTAEELGLDYDYVHVELGKGEQKKPEYLQRHPYGKIPALEHDGHRLVESASICRYLANINDHRMYSAEPLQAARIDQTIDMMVLHVGRWLGVYFWQEVICKKFFKKTPDAELIAEAEGFLKAHLPYFDHLLEENVFLCGSEVTIADTIAYAMFQVHEQTSADISAYPNILRWYGEFSERPSVAAVKARLEKQGSMLG
ncbi:MAG: glutathione S-transferase family protein [Ketobacter sp.]|nr:glutathione S-transferase family protein [Ketobacter sp.]